MVNDRGQLYTIEGIAASVLILTTVFLVLTTTTVLTPGETHIYDMQLEQIGNDVLAVMDLSTTWGAGNPAYPKSPLELFIEDMDNDGRNYFKDNFTRLANQTTGVQQDDIKFTANITYRTAAGIETLLFSKTHDYNRERAVMVTRWVNVDGDMIDELEDREQTVLLEVLLWRG
jgi:hypothetical protein